MMVNTYDRLLLHALRIRYFAEEHFKADDERGFYHEEETLLCAFIHPDGSVTRREFDAIHDALDWIACRRGPEDVLMMRDNRCEPFDRHFTFEDFRRRFEGRKGGNGPDCGLSELQQPKPRRCC